MDTAPGIQILIVDDEAASRLAARMMLEKLQRQTPIHAFSLQEASTLKEGLGLLQEHNFQIVILDKDLGEDLTGKKIVGTNHIKEILSIRPLCKIIVMTADQDPTLIAKAIRDGATDYTYKSFENGYKEHREAIFDKVLRETSTEIEQQQNQRTINTSHYGEFVSISSSMQKVKRLCEAYAESNRPVLLLGETGLGKGAVARLLHQNRAKFLSSKSRPFLNVNIGSMSDETAQSEIFGHEPNTFTGAGNRAKIGLLESGADGDIFLDEIGDASPEIQIKLLKVIDEGEFTRLGGQRSIKTNARFIFATNRDLKALVKKGEFREDLLSRISTFIIDLPPLKSRKEDIPEIVRVIIEKLNAENKHRKIAFSAIPNELMDYFCRDYIPGNIRGIENDLARLAFASKPDKRGFIDLSDWRSALGEQQNTVEIPNALSFDLLNGPTQFLDNPFPGLKPAKNLLERRILEEACAKYSSLGEIAEALGLTKAGVHQKLKYERLKIKNKKRAKSP